MTEQEILQDLLLPDLERRNPTDQLRNYLLNLIKSAEIRIKCEGITLDLDNIDDCMTVAMYAAYMYRYRARPDNPMPRMLRLRLNDRLLDEKMNPEVNDG